ncbi:MAG: cysteine desulfurase [Candidatus Micrarchaeota archaeon]|nr:cysteine desulfurase [Candidatus Micrarchaeota archaeon]
MNPEKLREDFPILVNGLNGKPVIYFDNACVTLKPRQVIEAMNEYYENFPACHGRSSHKLGLKVTEEYEKSRKTVAEFIRAKKPAEIVFVRNTTEAINLVANSLELKKGDVVVTTDKEHNSNLVPWLFLEKRRGIKRRIVPWPEDGNLDDFTEAVKGATLVSIVHTSNLDGTSLPVKEIVKISHDAGALVLVDGAQSVPHKETDVRKLDVDFLAFSGHKMLGPSGIGCLYGRYELLERMEPFLVGGDTVDDTTYSSCRLSKPPEKFEAGLQNYAGAIGLAAAVKYLKRVGLERVEKHEKTLNRIITESLLQHEQISVIGPEDPDKRGGIFSFTIKGIHPHDISAFLDEENIFIRSGAHCVHSWFNSRGIEGSARASFYLYNTKEEAEKFIEAVEKIMKIFG